MYSQNDPRWQGEQLGDGPDTIGADGCYLSSDADLLTWAGHPITPSELNALYEANGIYQEGESLSDSALHDAFPDLWVLDEVYHCEGTPCDQSKLAADDPNAYVVVELLGPVVNGVRLTHFAPVSEWQTWTIADTWDGQLHTIGERGAAWGWGSDSASLVGKVMRYRYVGAHAFAGAEIITEATDTMRMLKFWEQYHAFWTTADGELRHAWYDPGHSDLGWEVASLASGARPNSAPDVLVDGEQLHVTAATADGKLLHAWVQGGTAQWYSQVVG